MKRTTFNKKILFILFLSTILLAPTFGQFLKDSTDFTRFDNVHGFSWGDYDNDNDLDLLIVGTIAGSPIKRIYKNNGSGVFSTVDMGIPTIHNSCGLDWGDYDNDGDLDFVFIGSNMGMTYYGRIYSNDGNDNFNVSFTGLKGLYFSYAKWGDYDGDGDIDLVISGQDDLKAYTIIYKNNGGSFTNINAGLTGSTRGKLEWADYDNDGDLDLMVSGYDMFFTYNAKIYRNDGADVFTDIDASITQSVPQWFDYNSDGKLDILASYKISKQVGTDSFADIITSIPMGTNINTSSADYDNDGDLDVMLTGMIRFRMYRYDGGNTYSSQSDIFTTIRDGETFWIDYNNDGKQDLMIYGQNAAYQTFFKLYRNTTAIANAAPSVPSGITATTKGSSAIIHWNKSSDALTLQNGLFYNVRVGKTINGIDVVNPNANLSNGYLKLAKRGNAGSCDTFEIKGLKPGKYYYSIQSMDNNYNASAFSPVDSFELPLFDSAITLGFKQLYNSHIAWGDYDNDGDLDALLTGSDGPTAAYSLLYRNDGDDVFSQVNTSIKGVYQGGSEWADYDNDNDLDLLVYGNTKFTYPNFQPIVKVYRNDGGDNFVDLNLSISGVGSDGNATWGDYDNDGRVDIAMAGYLKLMLYHNDGNNKFTEKAIEQYKSFNMVQFADYDNDGDLDLSAVYDDWTAGPFLIRIYNNGGDGTFTNALANIPLIGGTIFGTMAWGDYDNDKDLDLLVISKKNIDVMRNDGANNFSRVFTAVDSIYGTAVWGDFDNDGDLDIAASGQTFDAVEKTRLFRNDGGDVFNYFTNLGMDACGTVAFVDIDNDNDLDVSLTVGLNNYKENTKFFRNNAAPNTVPIAPISLKHSFTVGTDKVNLSWKSTTDAEQVASAAKGLSYNISLYSLVDDKYILNSMSVLNNGTRKIVHKGNAELDTTYTIHGLTQGSYTWRVQAIDHAFAGSAFSLSDTFNVGLFADNPSDLSLCAGDTITIPYHLDGLAVNSDNVFVAQLSDPYGYFDVPTQIGAQAGTASGSLKAVIPSSALSGIKYKVRILSTNARYVGAPNASYITVYPSPTPNISGKPIVCKKDVGIDYKTYTAQGNSYLWTVTNGTITSGQNSAQILVKWATTTSGKVKVIETNAQGCSNVSAVDIIINALPAVKLGSDTTFCFGNSITKNAGSYYLYEWNTGVSVASIVITSSGDYHVAVTDDNGCKGVSDTITVDVKKPYDEAICMVTIDDVTGKNMIVWEKSTSKKIASYNIFREGLSAGVWNKIGTLLYSDLSIFVDNGSQPETKSYKYRISTIDSCGNESAMSPYHKTMLLTSSLGQQGINLIWSEYSIDGTSFGFDSYVIYRGISVTTLDSIDQIPSDNEMYPDINAPSSTLVYYRVAGKKPGTPCDPANLLKASSGPFSQSISNLEDNRLKESAIDKINSNNGVVSIIENPFSENIKLHFNITKEIIVSVTLLNSLGSVVYSDKFTVNSSIQTLTINAKNINPGVYYAHVKVGEKQYVLKAVKR